MGLLEHLGQQGMRLYLIHCLDFFLGWSAVSFPLFGSTSLTAAIVRIAFDILILVLFEHV